MALLAEKLTPYGPPEIMATPGGEIPSETDTDTREGVRLYRDGQYKAALQRFDRVLAIDDQRLEAWYGRAVTLLTLERWEEALEAVGQALKRNDKHAESWYAFGVAAMMQGRHTATQGAFDRTFELRKLLPDAGVKLYDAWATLTLTQGTEATLTNDIKTFEQAGLQYIDILEKAQQDDLGHVVAEALSEFKAGLKKKRELKAFAELELFIELMKIKDPFEGWRALGREVSKRWPKGVSAVDAIREQRD